MFKYILHATDLDEKHYEYCEQAVELANLLKAELYFLHVLEIPPSWQLAQGLGFAPNIPLPTEDTRTLMNVLGEQFHIPQERMIILEGNPKHKIIESIHDLQIDLLLIGAPSNQFLQGEITHISHYLVEHSPCSVFLMRQR
jgi:nucleotide-binding universal stress UspA family protein